MTSGTVLGMIRQRIAAIVAATVAVLGIVGIGFAYAANPAAAAVAPVLQLTLPVAYPGGVALDALGWGGTGTQASCATGTAVVNDEVGVWKASAAGCASDFYVAPAAGQTLTTVVQIEYAPDGNASGLCVSTITDVKGSFARLRPCATALNPWQDFTEVPAVSDITGAFELEAAGIPAVTPWTAYNLNDRAFGGDGSAVISYPATTGENQIWLAS